MNSNNSQTGYLTGHFNVDHFLDVKHFWGVSPLSRFISIPKNKALTEFSWTRESPLTFILEKHLKNKAISAGQ